MVAIRITTPDKILQFIAKTEEKANFLIGYFGQNCQIELIPVTTEQNWKQLCDTFARVK